MKTSISTAVAAIFLVVTHTSFGSNEGTGVQTLNPSASPSVGQIVFAADYSAPASMLHLWVSNFDGTGLTRLNTNALVDEEPTWSPDGSTIAFASMATGSSATNIWRVAPDGTGLVQLTSGSLNNRQPTWSPDGKKIAFVCDQFGTKDIWVMNADGTGRARVTTMSGQEDHPSFSPDGQSIVFSESALGKPLLSQLMVVGVDGSNPHAITDGLSPDWNPSWGPKGIVFSSRRDPTEHWKIWMVQGDGTGLRALGNVMGLDPVWTSDGRILFTNETVSTGALSAPSVLDPTTGTVQVLSSVANYVASIDVRPGKTPNDINLKSNGSVEVAILSTQGFDAPTAVDQTTLRFGHFGTEASLKSCAKNSTDANGDGVADLLCRFYITKSGLKATDTKAYLQFSDTNGTAFVGSDSIVITNYNDPADF